MLSRHLSLFLGLDDALRTSCYANPFLRVSVNTRDVVAPFSVGIMRFEEPIPRFIRT